MSERITYPCPKTSLFTVVVSVTLVTLSLTSTVCLSKIFGHGVEEEEINLESEAVNISNEGLALPEGVPELDRELVENSLIGEAMMLVQELPREERRKRNRNLVLSLRTLKVSLAGAFIWMKDHLHPSTCKTILEDLDYTPTCSMNMNICGCKLSKSCKSRQRKFDGIADTIEKAKARYDKFSLSCSCKNCCLEHACSSCISQSPRLKVTCCRPGPRESRFNICSIFKRIKSVASIYGDLLKDAIILIPIIFILRMSLINNFTSVLTWTLLLSILLPLVFSAIGTMLGDPTIILGFEAWKSYRANPPSWRKLLGIQILIFLFYFTIPAVLINAKEEAKAKKEQILKSGTKNLLETELTIFSTAHLTKIREVNEYLEEMRKAILTFKRNELSTEIVFQLVLQTITILLSPTNTRHSATHTGLQKVFETDHTGISKITSNLKTETMSAAGTSPNFGLEEETIATIFLISSILWSFKTTATTYIGIKTDERKEFFSLLPKVFLGLRSLMVYSVRIFCILSFFGPFLGLIDTLSHWTADQLMEKASDYTVYTTISLGNAFAIFLGLLLVQTIVIFIAKLAISKEFRKDVSKVSRILQHLALTVNLPVTTMLMLMLMLVFIR